MLILQDKIYSQSEIPTNSTTFVQFQPTVIPKMLHFENFVIIVTIHEFLDAVVKCIQIAQFNFIVKFKLISLNLKSGKVKFGLQTMRYCCCNLNRARFANT